MSRLSTSHVTYKNIFVLLLNRVFIVMVVLVTEYGHFFFIADSCKLFYYPFMFIIILSVLRMRTVFCCLMQANFIPQLSFDRSSTSV